MPVCSPWPDAIFDGWLPTSDTVLRIRGGDPLAVDSARWHTFPSQEERDLLERVDGPVLDVGCGPGRHVLELLRQGRAALGIDTSQAAVRTATRRGARAVHTSVFGPVPAAGQWGTILLIDGNIGIGGDAARLLGRCRDLLRPGGRILSEVGPPGGTGRRFQAQVVHGGELSPWFPWATVAASEVDDLAVGTQLAVHEIWEANRRWFAEWRRTLLAEPSASVLAFSKRRP